MVAVNIDFENLGDVLMVFVGMWRCRVENHIGSYLTDNVATMVDVGDVADDISDATKFVLEGGTTHDRYRGTCWLSEQKLDHMVA